MNKLNLVSYNVHGMNHPIKRKKILSQLKKMQCSIALLQETHLIETEHRKLKREWVDRVFHASYGKRRGVAILISKGTTFKVEKEIKDNMGRFVMIIGSIGDMTISILNVYAPTEEKETFFKLIAKVITSDAKGMILMGGDFNTVQNGRLDRLPPDQGPSTKKSRVLNNVTKELGLTDPWRDNNRKRRDYTFYSNPHGSYSRIDFFYVSQQHIHKVLKCDIGSITISDHAPVTLTIGLDNEPFFRYWRLNVSILSSERVVKEIKQNLKEYFQINDNGEVSPSILWEGGKTVIRGKIIEISSRLKRARLKKQRELENKIKELEREHKRTSDKSIFCELKTTRDRLDELLTFKAEGSLRFTGQKYYEMGNRASCLLAFQLRKAQTNRIISKIKHPTSKQTMVNL